MNENRARDAGHALLHQSRNPKVRKNPDVNAPFGWNLGIGYAHRVGVAFEGGSAWLSPRKCLQSFIEFTFA